MNKLIHILLKPLHKWIEVPGLIEINITKEKELCLEIAGQGYIQEQDDCLNYQYWNKLCFALANIAGFCFDEHTQPRLSTVLPGGHRFEAMLGPHVKNKISISIRIRNKQTKNLSDFGLTKSDASKLIEKVNNGCNCLVSGGTSSGKTTFLNTLIAYIPPSKRVLTVEDTPELYLPNFKNSVQYIVSRNEQQSIGYNQIIDHVMRSRPDIIMVGEVSVYNAYPILRLLNSGHQGFFTTIHANSAKLAIEAAFAQNVQLAGLSSQNISPWLHQTVDLVIHLKAKKNNKHVQEIFSPCQGAYW